MSIDKTWHDARLRRIEDVAEGARLFEIEPVGTWQSYRPGAHIDIQVMIGDRPDTRSYSLVGAPRNGVYRITVRRVADSRGGSRYLWGLEAGARLRITTPGNHFALRPGQAQYLLVAGGIGITPLLGMAEQLAGQKADVRMLYAGRTRAQLPYLDQLGELLGERLQVHSDEESGIVDLAGLLAGTGPDTEVYLCGPAPMRDAARQAWGELGRDPTRLRFETFGSGGQFAAQPFVVHLPRFGIDVTVPADRSLLDALEDAGVEVMADCLRGECGLCALKVIECDGRIDHRDVFFSASQKASNKALCTCVSRVIDGSITLDTSDRLD